MSSRRAIAWRTTAPAAALSLGLAAGLPGCCGLLPRALLESPADAQISAQVQALLDQSAAFAAPNLISVQSHGGVIYLRGLVATPYQVEAAGSIALRIAGVERVENLLSVDNAR